MTRHLFIPDVQAKDGVSFQHLEALGNYVVQKQPEVLVMIGDWALTCTSCKIKQLRYEIIQEEEK